MMNAIRSTIKSLRDWIADILEATKEAFAEVEAEKKNASPDLSTLLRDYMNLRKAERSDWSRYGQQKAQPMIESCLQSSDLFKRT